MVTGACPAGPVRLAVRRKTVRKWGMPGKSQWPISSNKTVPLNGSATFRNSITVSSNT